MKMKWIAAPYIVWMALFTVVPIFLIAWYALPARRGRTDPRAPHPLWGLGVCQGPAKVAGNGTSVHGICLVLGYPVALILFRRPSGGILAVLFQYCPCG